MFRKPSRRPANKPTLLRTAGSDGDDSDNDNDNDNNDGAVRTNDNRDTRMGPAVDDIRPAAGLSSSSSSHPSSLFGAKRQRKGRRLNAVTTVGAGGGGGDRRPSIVPLNRVGFVDNDDIDQDDEPNLTKTNDDVDANHRHRPRRRLGYGGGASGGQAVGVGAEDEDNGEAGVTGTMDAESDGVGGPVLYDKASLSVLQAEQRRFAAPPPSDPDAAAEASAGPATQLPPLSSGRAIPQTLHHHLWGDDPFVTEAMRVGDSAADPYRDPNGTVTTDSRDSSRPYLVPPTAPAAAAAAAAAAASADHHIGSITIERKVVSLQQIRDGLVATLASMSQRREEVLAPQLRRVQAQQGEARDELERHEALVATSGRALEYYQRLRHDLAAWVGAMRELQGKIVPVQAGLHELMAEMNCHQRRRDWQTDMVAVLFRHDRLDRVLGRQIDDPQTLFDPLQTDLVTVDEFGRSVQSQSAIQRERRRRRRQKIRTQREMNELPVRCDETDAYLSDDEKESVRARHDALLGALGVVMQELDDEFTSLQNLVNVFAEWKDQYPDEYRQCYAALSLADLSSVLILAELCALNDPWNESGGYNEGKWIAVIKDALDRGLLDDGGFERMLDKSVSPSVADLLQRSGYAIMSSRQSAALSSFVRHVEKIAPLSGSASLAKTKRKIQEYIALSLLDVSVPIVRADANALVSEELEEVLAGATVGQMHSLQKLLLNVITYWGPVLGTYGAFVESVLDFISSKFLFLISSLQQDAAASRFSESPVELFGEIWDALASTGWLTDSTWMLQTVAIRAAHSAFTARSSVGNPSNEL